MLAQLGLRTRIFLLFAGLASGLLVAIGVGLWTGYSRLQDPATLNAFVQVGVIAGFLVLGLVAWLWYLFDLNVAKPIDILAGTLRARAHADVNGEVDAAIARYLGDLAPAAAAAADSLAETRNALAEAVEIGRRAGVPVHISHLKGTTPQETDAIMTLIEEAQRDLSFSFDVYPYMPGSTMLNFLLPYEVWREGPFGVLRQLRDPRVRARCAHMLDNAGYDFRNIHIAWVLSKANAIYQGKTLAEYIEAVQLPPAEALLNLVAEENLAVLLVFNGGADEEVAPFIQHPCYMIGTDGIYQADSVIHPRQYGSAPRILGPWVRERKFLTLEEAVYKLSAFPAARFGLKERGQVREGWFADLIVFDAATIHDRATFAQPHQPAAGMAAVIVNGVPIIENGQPVAQFPTAAPIGRRSLAQIEKGHPAQLPGRALRFHQ